MATKKRATIGADHHQAQRQQRQDALSGQGPAEGLRRGRPPGTGQSAKLRTAIEGHIPETIEAMVAAAKSGDTAVAKLSLDRALPALRPVDKTTNFPVEPGLGATGRAILDGFASGRVSPDQGSRLLQALGKPGAGGGGG